MKNTKVTNLSEAECSTEIRVKIVQLLKDGAPHRMIFSMMQDCIDSWAKKKSYCIGFSVDFAKDYEVQVKLTKEKPKKWSSSYIRDFLCNLVELMSSGNILVYSFKLSLDEPVLLQVGEIEETRLTAYCFQKPTATIKE